MNAGANVMKLPRTQRFTVMSGLCAAMTAIGCASASPGSATTAVQPVSTQAQSSAAQAASGARPPVNAADVEFMSGMVPHHAQAVLIAGWAPSHGARPDIQRLCERIVVAQRDEIALMRNWLRDRGQVAPDSNATHMRMKMNGMDHDMLMPGMLTDEELAQLNRARGSEFDRLFLNAMIKHHLGAITMVDKLFGSHGGGQDEVVFRFASDVYADQTTEIERMEKMLAATPGSGH
jgi:uncharacterized protein (DUF305 family)